jgi:hypothetical protein
MYYIFFRNTNGRMKSTIHNLPLTTINIPTGVMEEDGVTMIYKEVPCKHIDLSKLKSKTLI